MFSVAPRHSGGADVQNQDAPRSGALPAMKRATDVVRAGRWPQDQRADTVTLLFDDRYRRRLRMLGDGGLDFLLDLVEPIVLHGGDGLRLEEGGYVDVKEADEELGVVRGRDAAAV